MKSNSDPKNSIENSTVDLSKETEVDLSKETEVDLSKEMEVDFNESSNYEMDDKLSKFKCDLCSEKFSSESNLMTHVELKHDISFSKSSNEIDIEKNPKISNHSRSPSKRRKILPSKFNNEENYNSGGKFQCPYCKSKFSQKHNLKTHVKKKHDEKQGSLHMEKKPFKCSICSKMFQFKDIMQLHKDDHKKLSFSLPL